MDVTRRHGLATPLSFHCILILPRAAEQAMILRIKIVGQCRQRRRRQRRRRHRHRICRHLDCPVIEAAPVTRHISSRADFHLTLFNFKSTSSPTRDRGIDYRKTCTTITQSQRKSHSNLFNSSTISSIEGQSADTARTNVTYFQLLHASHSERGPPYYQASAVDREQNPPSTGHAHVPLVTSS